MERLTIDQAIAHAQEVAETRTDLCDECRQEHEQLAKWLTKLKAYNDAEQDGQLVVLPCKVGDEVWTNFAMSGWYFRDKDRPYHARVVFVGLNDSDKMGRGLINVMYGKHDYMMQFSFADIGKSVFLSREEAEAALKGGA